MKLKAFALVLFLVLLVIIEESQGGRRRRRSYSRRRRYYHHHHYHGHHYHRSFVSQYNRFSRSLSSLYRIGTGLKRSGSQLVSLYYQYRRFLSNLYTYHSHAYHYGDEDGDVLFDDISTMDDANKQIDENLPDQLEKDTDDDGQM